ncbi:MAG: potassium transporter, partial [Proteobacteria bacterium]|nr:potassium transporter [Pseudomonadota bacterium]
MSFASVSSILGWALAVLGIAMTVPVAVGFGYGESDAAAAFAVAAVMTVFAAGLLIIATRGSRAAGTKRENVAATVAVWVVAPLFAALPLYAAGAASGALNAWFESVSGLTTTGATAIGPIEAAGHATLIWRAMLQWLGGVATVMTVVVHLAHLGVGGMQLYPGAMLHGEQDPLLERLASTGLAVSAVFAILAAACFVALLATGIPAFDAVAHALATVSTGGFSTRDGSVGAFANPAAEAVLIVFMVLGAANASLHWLVVRRRNPREYWRDPEFLRFVSVAALAAAAISVALAALSGVEAGEAIRHGAFAAVSAITTTGFSTGGDIAWPLLAPLLLLVLMLAGGCTGS